MEVAVAARCGPMRPAAQPGPRQADSGPTSERVGGASTVDATRTNELCATERCRPDRLRTVRVLAAPDAPERVSARDEHEDEDEHLEAPARIRRQDGGADVHDREPDRAVEHRSRI